MAPPDTWAIVPSCAYDIAMTPLERRHLARMRAAVIAQATGDVLELGAGTGVNLAYYDPARITALTLSDRTARPDIWRSRVPHPLLERTRCCAVDATTLPFDTASFDTVVATLLFCSVPRPDIAFNEIRRVLRPGGRYLFLEHVRPPGRWTGRLFDLAAPAWRAVAAGCNLNRRTLATMRRAQLRPSVHETAARGIFISGSAQHA